MMDGPAGGRVPAGTGWFVLNVDDVSWFGLPNHAFTDLQGALHWEQYGFSIDAIEPGGGAMYHRESHEDESFFVLDGELDLVIEGELHRVEAGDLIHCPARTAHILVGAGERTARVVMLGARNRTTEPRWCEYVPDAQAAALGKSVTDITREPPVAYAAYPQMTPQPNADRWALDRSTRTKPRADVRIHGRAPEARADWFVMHVDDMPWVDNGLVARCIMDQVGAFEQYGIVIHVLRPGEPNCRYHRESFDETMLVLDGEATLIVEGEERPVRAGDVIHCPAGAAHVFVGAGDRPCAIFMLGTRDDAIEQAHGWGEYVPDPTAAKYGASVDHRTTNPDEAYADRPPFVAAESPWKLRST